MSRQGSESIYLSAVSGRQAFRTAFRREREINRHLREALVAVRSKGICAGAAFVRQNDDGAERCVEVLNIIDDALAFEPAAPAALQAHRPHGEEK